MNKKPLTSLLCLGALLLATQVSFAAGDAKKGANAFAEECGDCHSTTPGKNKKGPGLFAVVGRKSGSVSDFSGYSEAMKQSGLTWTGEQIDSYITHPKKVVPAGKMKYGGLDDAATRADIIAYLSSLK